MEATFSENEKNFAPLEGIRVMDLTRILAGPYCTMILGDLGAEVIKVERPGVGDDTRSWGPPWVAENESAYFLSTNRNKKSVTLDLKTKEGSDIARQLALKSDVLVENYIPGKLSEMQLGYEQLKEINPRLIYVSITGFGQSGPYANRAGYDNIAMALGGLMHITGPEDGEPCRVGVAMIDLSTGLYAYGAVMAALLYRQKTGRGQHIDCNLLNTQVATLTHIASNYLNCGAEAKRYGTGHPSIVPYQAFKTKDGYMLVGAGNERLYVDLCQRIGVDDMINDDRFSSNEKRVQNREELIKRFSERFSTKTNKEWMAELEGCRFPYGPINNMKEVFSDPQVLYSGMIQEMEHPSLGNIRVPGPAVKYSESEVVLQGPPPLLGQHTDEVLQDLLKYDQKQIQELKDKNVL